MKRTILPLAVLLTLSVLGAVGDQVNPYLQFDRQGIEAGQLWRVLTGHAVHMGLYHTALNVGALLLGLFLFGEVLSRRLWTCTFLVLALLISLCLYVFSPEVNRYAGLSGVLHGAFAVGVLLRIRAGEKWYALALLLLAAKLVREQLPGYDVSYLLEETGAPVLVDAHLYGALCGVGVALASFAATRSRNDTE